MSEENNNDILSPFTLKKEHITENLRIFLKYHYDKINHTPRLIQLIRIPEVQQKLNYVEDEHVFAMKLS
ncbi:MAG: hypothetical protein KDH96_13120, partial [Candidatus Riesia sp.]|nr:hypothetical protein [Candidatus Riesia sp.]